MQPHPFSPLPCVKIFVSGCICSAEAVLVQSLWAQCGWPWMGPVMVCPAKGAVESLPRLWTDGVRALGFTTSKVNLG